MIDGFLMGFGSALAIITFASWHLLTLCLNSGYLIVKEADVIGDAQVATEIGVVLGVLLIVAGLGLELLRRKKALELQRNPL